MGDAERLLQIDRKLDSLLVVAREQGERLARLETHVPSLHGRLRVLEQTSSALEDKVEAHITDGRVSNARLAGIVAGVSGIVTAITWVLSYFTL